MKKFTLVIKDIIRIKVFEPFDDVSKSKPSIDAIMIFYLWVYKSICKPVMNDLRLETIEEARKEYKNLLEEGWRKTSI